MTEQEQRISIAEACGWKRDGERWTSPTGKTWGSLPNYLKDLNAMSQAIMTLCKKKRLKCFCNSGLDGTWECVLTESDRPNCIPCDGDHYGAGDTLCEAMKEAFLRAIGKWKD